MIEKLKRRLLRYFRTYLVTLRAEMANYPESYFPSYLKGAKRALFIYARNGIVAAYYPATSDSFTFAATDRTVESHIMEMSDGVFSVDLLGTNVFDNHVFGMKLRIEFIDGEEVTVTPPWHILDYSSKVSIARWGEEIASVVAARDVLTCVAARSLHLDPAKEAPSTIIGSLENVIDDFSNLLEQAPREEDIQVFLTAHPFLLSSTALQVIPKVRLGNEFVTDFVIQDIGNDYILVEIEKSTVSLFTKKGDPTHDLSHALRQVKEWRHWVREHAEYARSVLPGISDPMAWLIIGRRESESQGEAQAANLRRETSDLHRIRVLTFDDILDHARQQLTNLKRYTP